MFSLNASLYSLICFISWSEYPISLNLDSLFLFSSFNLRYSFIVSVSSLSFNICIFLFSKPVLFYIAFTLLNTGVVTATPTKANAILLLALFLKFISISSFVIGWHRYSSLDPMFFQTSIYQGLVFQFLNLIIFGKLCK